MRVILVAHHPGEIKGKRGEVISPEKFQKILSEGEWDIASCCEIDCHTIKGDIRRCSMFVIEELIEDDDIPQEPGDDEVQGA